MKLKGSIKWIIWLVFTLLVASYLGYRMYDEDKTLFLPGKTSHGHHQIEMACAACHTDKFGGKKVLQAACMKCHGEELKLADDNHPRSKFTDPRNADRIKKIDALYCVTCHVEHKPELTGVMGVTMPQDFCVNCHYDIAKDRPSHKDLPFTGCASAGCHNYHDNRALYEDFLLKHLHEKDVLSEKKLLQRNLKLRLQTMPSYPLKEYPLRSFTRHEQDAPPTLSTDGKLLDEWYQSAHAQSGVNCSACHNIDIDGKSKKKWLEKPDQKICVNCHKQENEDFLNSMHGMRLAQGLSPMSPAMSVLKMDNDSKHQQLSCFSCHSTHRFDTKYAAINACLNCHADQHSQAYKHSLHNKYWRMEQQGEIKEGNGVSCATCHFPRHEQKQNGKHVIRVMHNQNDNLRPNEKMIRSVCMNCHGLGFSIDALADRALIDKNFTGLPAKHIKSLDMIERRVEIQRIKGNKKE